MMRPDRAATVAEPLNKVWVLKVDIQIDFQWEKSSYFNNTSINSNLSGQGLSLLRKEIYIFFGG